MPDRPETDKALAAPASEPLPLPVLITALTFCAAVLLSAVVWAGVRLWPEKQYPTDTPMGVIESAGRMLEDRRADRLVELIEAVPPGAALAPGAASDPAKPDDERVARMEDLLIRLGRVLAAAQDLHRAIEREMPEELEQLAAEVEKAERRGEATGLLASLMPNRRGGDNPERRAARERAIARVLADPFGRMDEAVNENIGRVGIAELGAGSVAVTWDGRPILPPLGLTMREHPEGWRIVPPTSLPMLRRYLPDTPAEFEIWGSLLATVEGLLDDLRAGVESGRIESLESLSRRAIEDAVIPIGMVMVALGNAEE